MKSYYNNHVSVQQKNSQEKAQLIFSILNEFVDFKKCVVLDVGCFNGKLTIELAKKFKFVKAIDSCKKSINVARINCPKNVEFQVGNVLFLGFNSNCFDVIVCNQVIPYLNDFEVFVALKELKRVIKPNGVIYLSFPNKRFKIDNAGCELKGVNLKEIIKFFKWLNFKYWDCVPEIVKNSKRYGVKVNWVLRVLQCFPLWFIRLVSSQSPTHVFVLRVVK